MVICPEANHQKLDGKETLQEMFCQGRNSLAFFFPFRIKKWSFRRLPYKRTSLSVFLSSQSPTFQRMLTFTIEIPSPLPLVHIKVRSTEVLDFPGNANSRGKELSAACKAHSLKEGSALHMPTWPLLSKRLTRFFKVAQESTQ